MSDPFSTTQEKIVLTAKGGKGYDDPWVVIHATDVRDAADSLLKFDPTVADALAGYDLGLAVAQASVNFQAKVALARGLTPVRVQAAEAPAEPEAPSGWGSAPKAPSTPPASPKPQWQKPAAPAGGGYNPPQPSEAPVGESGYSYDWVFGTKDGKNWKGWLSGQPKADIDAGAPKDKPIFIR